MSFRLELDSVNKIVRLSLQGEVTDEFFWVGYEALRNCCNQYCPCRCIVDYSEATKVKISSGDVRYLASKPPIFPLDCLTLNVAPQDEMYGIARVFQSVAENRPNFLVVRTMEEALDLLELKSPKFEAIEVRLDT